MIKKKKKIADFFVCVLDEYIYLKIAVTISHLGMPKYWSIVN